MSDFKSLKLAAPINAALEELGYTTPTPIQEQAIPDVLKGRDLMGIAQTGTGKTAAFSLPLLNHILVNDFEPPKKGARALILAPTRELASQIAESIREYGKNMEFLSVTVVFGGVPIQRQIKRLSGGNDIIVATPGRLIDLLDRRSVTLKDIEFLILDEADQMMDMGFIHALKKIVPLLPKERQTLFFSATMVPAIKKLARQFTNDPVTVSVTPPNSTAEKVEQRITFVDKAEKQNLLGLSLLDPDVDRALVFTRTKHGADRVVKRLAQIGIDSMAIHGNKSQAQRQRALLAFREDQIKVLVATDVAARGIDIPGITHVFNFEIPNVPEQYVHRIGRTARANRSGIAHAFVDKDERAYLKDIQKLLKTTIPVVDLPEDFVQKARALKTRKPIVRPVQPKQEPRKGRGKSRKKARVSKDRDKTPSSGRGSRNQNDRSRSAPHEARGKASEKSRNPSREKRDHKPHSDKPKDNRSKGDNSSHKKSWGSDAHAPERRRKAPTRDSSKTSSDKTSGKNPNGESQAERKAKNQHAHAKQHSRKPRRDGKSGSDGPKSPQRYGKRPNKSGGGKPAHRKGPK
ncbi:DEAD/DEAH box helicase [Hellea balneolensis]|uniref:DEAD/DEAH box helicase n=1 Tax=Hellea balneolensis TaxID=287478 RepID=UPI0004289980|nr:DEAD/DEAH box helicase [Hellea balneolensis]